MKSGLFQSVEEVHSSLSNTKEATFFHIHQSMTSLSIWRSVRSTPVDQRDDRDPARREAAEEAWARAHGKREISFGKYGFSLSRQLERAPNDFGAFPTSLGFIDRFVLLKNQG